MASGPEVDTAREMLDMILADDVEVRLWTVSPVFGGTGGTEVTGGGYEPAILLCNPAVAGTSGQIAKATNAATFFFADMPVSSSAISAISVHRRSDGKMRWLNDSYSPPVPWSVGESPSWPAGTFAVAFVPVS